MLYYEVVEVTMIIMAPHLEYGKRTNPFHHSKEVCQYKVIYNKHKVKRYGN